MLDFIWVISADRQSSVGTQGISESYVVPQGDMHGFEHKLPGGKIWLMFKGQQNRFFGMITIARIERFLEGLNKGDFLVHPDLLKSFRFCTNYDDAINFTLLESAHFNLGIDLLNPEIADLLRLKVSNTIETKFTKPVINLSRSASSEILDKQKAVIGAVTRIVQNMNLNQIWASGIGLKLDPISNFAWHLLLKENHQVTENDLLLLKEINLVQSALNLIRHDQENLKAKEFRTKGVDLSFTEIDPNNVYAREFVSGEEMFYNLDEALNKTDIAERLHQSILRDISEYLQNIGITAFESSSIDLMIQTINGFRIFEIKGVHFDNFIAQAAKGAFQIASYTTALQAEGKHVDAFLIVNKIQEQQLEEFVLRSLNYLGVKCLIYDKALPWPERLANLTE